nr:MAG TPA: SmD3, SmB (1-95), SmD1 (1-85) snRNP, Spliceosome, Pre-mRNA splicing [Bacteriophage sp.]
MKISVWFFCKYCKTWIFRIIINCKNMTKHFIRNNNRCFLFT